MNGSRDKNKKVPIITESELQNEICKFDSVLDILMEFFDENEAVWDTVGGIRDRIHLLQQHLRKRQVIDYSQLSQRNLLADWSREYKEEWEAL